jgi:hypothetical protein
LRPNGVGTPAAVRRRIAGSGLFQGLIVAVLPANAIALALGLGAYARGRAADAAVGALEDVTLGSFVW